MGYIRFLLALVIFTAASASAQVQATLKQIPMNAYFVAVNCPSGIQLDDQQIQDAISLTKLKYQEIGVNMLVRKIYRINDIHPELNGLYTREKQLAYAGQLSQVMGLARPRRVVHFVFCRMNEGYFAGYARGICKYHTRRNSSFNTSVSNGGMFSVNNEPRFMHSVYAIVHETGHLSGAWHVSSKTVMNPNALFYVNEMNGNLSWDPKSQYQIRQCLGAKSRKQALGLH